LRNGNEKKWQGELRRRKRKKVKERKENQERK
jgi:hypothetical protein